MIALFLLTRVQKCILQKAFWTCLQNIMFHIIKEDAVIKYFTMTSRMINSKSNI